MEKHKFLAAIVPHLAAFLDQYWERIERLDLTPSQIILICPSTQPAALSPEAIDACWQEIENRKSDLEPDPKGQPASAPDAPQPDAKKTTLEKPGKRPKKDAVKPADTAATVPAKTADTGNEFAEKQRANIEEKANEVMRLTVTIKEVKAGNYNYSTWEACNNKVSSLERDITNMKSILYPVNGAIYDALVKAFEVLEAEFDTMKVPEQGSKPLTDLAKEGYVGLYSKVDWEAPAVLQEIFDGGTAEDHAANLVITKVYWFTKEEEAIKVFSDYLKAEGVTLEQFAEWVEYNFSRRDKEPAARTAALVKYLREVYLAE